MISMIENINSRTPNDNKTPAIARIIREKIGPIRGRALVVGCGSGVEAAILAQELNINVIGIDIKDSFDPIAAAQVELRKGDATCLDFEDDYFDFVYSYHALEHIPDYRKALSEMNRVLSGGGYICIGTPNRLRLIGYLGSKNATLSKKLKWNMADLRARLQGRFRNEYGAHAGYSSSELQSELGDVFSHVEEITLSYYLEIYKRHVNLIRLIVRLNLASFLFPSIYFVGRK